MTEPHHTDPSSDPSQQEIEPTGKVKVTDKLIDDLKVALSSEPVTRTLTTWNSAAGNLLKLLPVDQIAQTLVKWFSVSEDQVAEILETVRAELPTTEALLIGKPQAGKSSIVRGLTGVSAEIVGQGFRPHTQHTERYAYPSSDLPLLIFTDTVGLGDVNQDTDAIIQELVGDLQESDRRARVLILTIKINDFATDTLRHIAQQLRQKYPEIPVC